jgi:hypothetical protein
MYLLVARWITQINCYGHQNTAIWTAYNYHTHGIGDVLGRISAGNCLKNGKLWYLLA